MSKSRPILSRPRTKVYESNYNIGESYYKPAIDGLDMKYGRRYGNLDLGPPANGDIFSMRTPIIPMERPKERPMERSMEMPSLRREMEEDDFFADAPRRRPNSAVFEREFDSMFEGRMRNGMSQERPPARGRKTLDEEIEDDISSSMKRLRAVRGGRSMAEDFDEMESSYNVKKESRMRPKLDFSEKIMDSVGLGRGARAQMEEDNMTGRRRFLKMTTSASEIGDGEEYARWTALKPGPGRRMMMQEEEDAEAITQSAAAARARKSRARLDDLESEMQALSERSAARDKRVRDLKALVQENEASSLDNLQTTVRVKSSIQSEKKSMAY